MGKDIYIFLIGNTYMSHMFFFFFNYIICALLYEIKIVLLIYIFLIELIDTFFFFFCEYWVFMSHDLLPELVVTYNG